MLKLFYISILLIFSLNTVSATISCTNPDQNRYGEISNMLMIEATPSLENKYLNGKIIFRGYELQKYFEEELNRTELQVRKEWRGGGGNSYYVYTIRARVYITEKIAFRTGRHEAGFQVFPDYGGIKIVSLYNGAKTGKEWWFKNCGRY